MIGYQCDECDTWAVGRMLTGWLIVTVADTNDMWHFCSPNCAGIYWFSRSQPTEEIT